MSLDPRALAKAREAYLAALRTGLGPSDVVARVVEAYTAMRPPEPSSRLCAGVRRLMAMAVGEEHLAKGVTAATAQRWAYSARRRMDNPHARWTVETVESGVAIRRLADGPMHDPRRNALAVELSELRVGEGRLSQVRKTAVPGSIGAAAIAQARRILGSPKADWSFSTGKTGVWIKRIAPGEIKRGRRKTAMSVLPTKAAWILEKVARRHRLAVTTLRSKKRTAPITLARHEAWLEMALLERPNGKPLWALSTIAEWFGVDHASVSIALGKLGYRRSDVKKALTEAA